jgi:FkbH-like protein
MLEDLKNATAQGRVPAPAQLRVLAGTDDPATLRKAGRTLAALRADGESLRQVNIGLLSTATLGPLAQILRSVLVADGMLPEFTIGAYGSFELQLAEPASELLADGQAMLLCVIDASYFLPREWHGAEVAALCEFISERAEALRGLLASAARRSSTSILVHTIPLPGELRNTVISWRGRAELSRAWYRLNATLLELAEAHRGIAVIDFVSALAEAAVPAQDDRMRRYAEIPYTDAALVLLAREVRRFLRASTGRSSKVLALDLDNTLWGGVLGETGPAGVQLGGLYPGNCYTHLQRTARRLRDQGVILVLASKNDAADAESALAQHPEVVLRPELFSAMAVNWSDKAGNLREMADDLGLSTESFVFMDDSPFECGHVADELPGVRIVSADGDPAHLVRSLVGPGWFDILELTGTDQSRPMLYRARAERNMLASSHASAESYLRSLGIRVMMARATPFDVPRIAQLAARTNQFNLTGRRYGQSETASMAADPDHLVISFAVTDSFGPEGVVGAAWVECGHRAWQVLNFVMSCRVLGRGVEQAVVAWLARRARDAGASVLEGRFVRSARNGVAESLWPKAGFALVSDDDGDKLFELALDSAGNLLPDWINLEDE